MEEPEPIHPQDLMTDSRNALYRAICPTRTRTRRTSPMPTSSRKEGNAAQAAFIRAQIAIAAPFRSDDPLFIATRIANPRRHQRARDDPCVPPVPDGFGWTPCPARLRLEGRRPLLHGLQDGVRDFEAAPIQALGRCGAGDWRQRHWPTGRSSSESSASSSLRSLRRDDADRLGHSPFTTKLTELVFDFAGISSEGLEALARSPLFPRLKSLDLRSNAMPPALLADALGASAIAGALTSLSLASNRITRIDAEHLFALPALRGLTHLDLSDNPRLGPVGGLALAESGLPGACNRLNWNARIPACLECGRAPRPAALAGIRSLNLAANRLGPNAIKQLCQPDAASSLRILNLAG